MTTRTRFSAEGSAREMEIYMQQIGCFHLASIHHLLITFKWMLRFEPFLGMYNGIGNRNQIPFPLLRGTPMKRKEAQESTCLIPTFQLS